MAASPNSLNEMERVIPKGSWLEKANHKANLLRKSIVLKKQVGNELYRKYLAIYEARENYLNQMAIEDLKKLINDLEKVADKKT